MIEILVFIGIVIIAIPVCFFLALAGVMYAIKKADEKGRDG